MMFHHRPIINVISDYLQELNSYRGMLGELFNYDCISVPLVYTQVNFQILVIH